ncbi:endocuticle structural glycoprotein SgAbd-2-like [Sitophilus oryzae]|uniref:Endocuticle structural glycoprotein SgAbd-2-like n=1 Tax=Sitophilus oryzae TaxID=7048 RepID=A0A6J2XFG0_SITOR|nr:endocuticle structural glycoprotein SgAbd-2-like [Sitophilus oryzae]
MFKLVVASALVAFVAADVSHLFSKPGAGQNAQIPILKFNSDVRPDGSYEYSYQTGNGINVEERGQQTRTAEGEGTAAQGFYQFTSPEGVPVYLQYVADENGFQPQSDVLPTPPPIPAAILRSLEYNAAHPEQEEPASKFQVAQKPFFGQSSQRRFRRFVSLQ